MGALLFWVQPWEHSHFCQCTAELTSSSVFCEINMAAFLSARIPGGPSKRALLPTPSAPHALPSSGCPPMLPGEWTPDPGSQKNAHTAEQMLLALGV